MRLPALALSLAVVVPASACGRAGGSHAAIERDSAGIRIVESVEPAWPDGGGWQVAAAPHVDIGGSEDAPGHDLDDVTAVVVMSDGRLAVANGGSNQIRLFNRAGALLAVAGGKGEGPGEFDSLSRLYLLPGDSLLAIDAGLRRLTVFDSTGRLARTARLDDAAGAATPFLLLADQTLLARRGFSVTPATASGIHRDTLQLFRFDLEGRFVDSVGRYPGSENFVLDRGTGRLFGPLPLGKQSRFAASQNGFLFGSGDRYEIELRAPDGALLRLVRLPRPNRELTADDAAMLRGEAPGASPDELDFWRQLRSAIQLPTRYPAHGALREDAEGFLWVEEHAGMDDTATAWQVFDPDGRWLGAVIMPARLNVLRIESDEVIGVWRDELDVQRVRAYRLDRAR